MGGRCRRAAPTSLGEEEEPDEDEEEECEEAEDDSDSDSDCDERQPVCLPTLGDPLPPSEEPPKDADEYLRRVQWERMHCQEVVDVEVEERVRQRKPRETAPGSLLLDFGLLSEDVGHCKEWAVDVVVAFRSLRARCAAARRAAEAAAALESLDRDAWRGRLRRPEGPSVELLASQDVLSHHRLLVVAVDALIRAREEGQSAFAVATPRSAEWAFAALAFVEEPLVDDMQYNLQRLRRVCQKAIVASRVEGDEGGISTASRAQASLLLVIATDVFGQV